MFSQLTFSIKLSLNALRRVLDLIVKAILHSKKILSFQETMKNINSSNINLKILYLLLSTLIQAERFTI